MKPIIILFCLLAAVSSTRVCHAADTVPCKSYLLLVEHDEATAKLFMDGPNKAQQKWASTNMNNGDSAGVCLIWSDATGKRSILAPELKDLNPSIYTRAGSAPLYVLSWEQIEKNTGGKYDIIYKSAFGALYLSAKAGDLTPISPVHDTNKTAFSDSSISLLKAAIKTIQTGVPAAAK